MAPPARRPRRAMALAAGAFACLVAAAGAGPVPAASAVAPSFQALDDKVEAAKAVLRDNWSVDHTLPSTNLYPEQWSWDSAFIAIGYSHYDVPRGMQELETLFKGQWSDGRLPHIVFNTSVATYFPDYHFWQTNRSAAAPRSPPTSGIVQPPVHPLAVRELYTSDTNRSRAEAFLRRMYPKLTAWVDYLYRERDPDGDGLVYIVHPWESGMDNSPAWDRAFRNINITHAQVPPYHRQDTHRPGVNPADRPSNWTYDRFVYLVGVMRDDAYNDTLIRRDLPFRMVDVVFNTIVCEAANVTAQLASFLRLAADQARFTALARRTRAGMDAKLWSDTAGMYLDHDELTGELVPDRIAGGLTPLLLDAGNMTRLAAMLDTLTGQSFCGPEAPRPCYAVPTIDVLSPNFTTHNYWRGPTWINIDWLILNGLVRHTKLDKARALRQDLFNLVLGGDFGEYFDPYTGAIHGATHFSWTAALFIDAVANDPDHPEHDGGGFKWSDVNPLTAAIVVAAAAAIMIAVGYALYAWVKSDPYAQQDKRYRGEQHTPGAGVGRAYASMGDDA